ncbi:site-specific DNA-methyltransferase [bacterium]|nr:site-specific DNA-methyltransferase [bacterium]
MQNGLNGAQTRALAKLKAASNEEFQRLTEGDKRPLKSEIGHVRKDSCQTSLKEMSAREINNIADRAVKKENLKELHRARVSQSLNSKAKTFMMSRWGIPAPRIATRLEVNRLTALKYSENPSLVRSVRSLLKKGYDVEQVSKELGCPEPLVWSIALEGKSDQERFKSLGWGLRTWDQWFFNDLDRRFGDDWPGQIPAQLVGHTLCYFSKVGDLVFDPMAGGGVVPDVCLAFGRKCWSFDLVDRPETRPEIEPFQWNPERLLWPVNGKEKPDLIFFDPPYFSKMAKQYAEDSISVLSREEYLEFFKEFFPLIREHTKSYGRLAFLIGDWRNFQGISAMEEDPDQSILLPDYFNLLERSGWKIAQLIDCPLSTERFRPHMVKRMQKNKSLGTVRRSLIVGIKI